MDLSRLPVKGDSTLLQNSVVSHKAVIFLMKTNLTNQNNEHSSPSHISRLGDKSKRDK
jgi:hypothetical protein